MSALERPALGTWMSGLGRARMLALLDHDQLMDVLRAYSQEPRTREEAAVCDQIAWEFHVRQRPEPFGATRGPGFTANGESVEDVLARYGAISRQEAANRGLLGDCVQHVGGWDCHLREGVRWPA